MDIDLHHIGERHDRCFQGTCGIGLKTGCCVHDPGRHMRVCVTPDAAEVGLGEKVARGGHGTGGDSSGKHVRYHPGPIFCAPSHFLSPEADNVGLSGSRCRFVSADFADGRRLGSRRWIPGKQNRILESGLGPLGSFVALNSVAKSRGGEGWTRSAGHSPKVVAPAFKPVHCSVPDAAGSSLILTAGRY